MTVFRQVQEARRIAFEKMLSHERADLARRTSLPGAVDRAVAIARADAPIGGMGTTLARILPTVARAAAGLGVCNPKLWEADVRPLRGRKVDDDGWLTRVRAAARARETGDVLAPTIVRTAELIVWDVRTAGTGFARLSFQSLANLVQCSKETARKAIRFLEEHGLLDTFNVLRRGHGLVRRVVNLYLIPDAAPEPDRPAASSLAERLSRYAQAFGLRARAWGLNATPARVGYRPARGHPSPS